jgi:iron complex transport system ATP-binding protein
MLQASHVSFAYRAGAPLVIDEVSVAIAPGELVGILGPNGSGKTTLLKILNGTLTPSNGTIQFDQRPLSGWKRRDLARRIALVPQETHAPFDFTVLDIVLMGRYPHLGTFALEGPADLSIAKQALASTGTSAFEDRPFATLSGGEKQRVVIASALAQSPELLLLDEPTASLDLGHQLDVQLLLAGLNRDRGVTMVLSTHDLNLAAALCRHLILLRDGRVIAQGPTEDVLTPDTVRALYGVEADVYRRPGAGHLTVTPVARVS